MRYQILSEVGYAYSSEEGNAAPVRNQVLQRLETNLKNAIAAGQLAWSHRPLPAIPGSGQPQVPTPPLVLNQINDSRRRARIYRDWITRQGAVVDEDGNVDWAQSAQVVVYDSDPRLQRLSKVRYRSGLLYADHSRTVKLDTRDMVTSFSGPGKGIYVMSQSGDIHVGSHAVGHRHHSSLLAAADTAAAGEIEVRQGRVVWLSNKSGHYRPNLKNLCQILHQVQKKHVPLTFRLSVMTTTGRQNFAKVDDFMSDLDLKGEPDYELDKLLRYKAHLKRSVLNRNGWMWNPAATPPGVYAVGTSTLVPHKTVRQWLKSQGLNPKTKRFRGYGR